MERCLFADTGTVHVLSRGKVYTLRWREVDGEVVFDDHPKLSSESIHGLLSRAYTFWRGIPRELPKTATRLWDWLWVS